MLRPSVRRCVAVYDDQCDVVRPLSTASIRVSDLPRFTFTAATQSGQIDVPDLKPKTFLTETQISLSERLC